MTVQTALPAWEANFFAGIMLEAAETKATEAKRQHETDANSDIAALEGQDRNKVIVARTNLSHSLKRLHFVQKNLRKAKAEVAQTSIVTFHQ